MYPNPGSRKNGQFSVSLRQQDFLVGIDQIGILQLVQLLQCFPRGIEHSGDLPQPVTLLHDVVLWFFFSAVNDCNSAFSLRGDGSFGPS